MDKIEYNNIVMDNIIHFFGEGGHPIIVKDSEVFIILEEFPYLELFESNRQNLLSYHSPDYTGFMVRLNGEISDKHKLLFYKDELFYYKNEYNRYRDALDDLIND